MTEWTRQVVLDSKGSKYDKVLSAVAISRWEGLSSHKLSFIFVEFIIVVASIRPLADDVWVYPRAPWRL